MVENITSFSLFTGMEHQSRVITDRNIMTFVMPHDSVRRYVFDCMSLTAGEKYLAPLETWRLMEIYHKHGLAKTAARIQYIKKDYSDETKDNNVIANEVITRMFGARYVRKLISCPQVVQAEIKLLVGEPCPIEGDYWTSSLEWTWPELIRANQLVWENRSEQRPVILLDPFITMPERYEEILTYTDSQVFLLVSGKQSAIPERAFDDRDDGGG